MREAIALQMNAVAREIKKDVAAGWLNLAEGDELEKFVEEKGWKVEGENIVLPVTKENEAKTQVFRENVAFNRRCPGDPVERKCWRSGTRTTADIRCRIPERHPESLRAAGLSAGCLQRGYWWVDSGGGEMWHKMEAG